MHYLYENMSDINREQLIELVRARPSLWDNRCDAYHDAIIRENDWSSIANELGQSAAFCRSMWKNMRDQFKKKHVTKDSSGSAAKRTKPYVYAEQMSFLNAAAEERSERSSNLSSTESSTLLNEEPIVDQGVQNSPKVELSIIILVC